MKMQKLMKLCPKLMDPFNGLKKKVMLHQLKIKDNVDLVGLSLPPELLKDI
jgi:hypothetical protein